jgi:hypothetical protein
MVLQVNEKKVLRNIVTNVLFGCSIETLKGNAQDEWRLPESSETNTIMSRDTKTDISTYSSNGLNEMTQATNNYGTTETWYDEDDYGVANLIFSQTIIILTNVKIPSVISMLWMSTDCLYPYFVTCCLKTNYRMINIFVRNAG